MLIIVKLLNVIFSKFKNEYPLFYIVHYYVAIPKFNFSILNNFFVWVLFFIYFNKTV